MPTQVEIHPTAKIAALVVGVALLLSLSIVGTKRLLSTRTEDQGPQNTTKSGFISVTSGNIILPVINLSIADAQLESHWSSALATALSGHTEVPVEGGRVDVLTEHYAIEVDRLEKWHEAIGQAAHYGLKTGKTPVAALMIPSDLWPISPTTETKLLLIDDTCRTENIKLVLLRRINSAD